MTAPCRSTTASGPCPATSTGSRGRSSWSTRRSPRCACSPIRRRPARSASRCPRTSRPRRSRSRRRSSRERTWTVFRRPPAPDALDRAAALIRGRAAPAARRRRRRRSTPRRPRALRAFADATGIPVGETQAGRGALPSAHPAALGAIGATGTPAANRLAREADVVIGVGTRWSDFTTASKSAFQDPDVRFVNVNVAGLDAAKHSGLPLEADARLALDALRDALAGWRADADWQRRARRARRGPGTRRSRASTRRPRAAAEPGRGDRRRQRRRRAERDVVVCAAGSMPGDLHKLWRARDPDARATTSSTATRAWATRCRARMGVKLAAPEREVFAMVGDGSYLMLPGRAGDGGRRGDQARRRAGPEPRLRVDRRAVALGRRRPATDAYRVADGRRAAASTTGEGDAAAPGRPGRQRGEPRGAGAARADDRRAARRARRGARARRRTGRRPRRDRPLRGRAELRGAGGTCRWRRSAATTPCAPRAPSTRARRRRGSARTWRASEPARPPPRGRHRSRPSPPAGRTSASRSLALDAGRVASATQATRECCVVVIEGTGRASQHGDWRDLGARRRRSRRARRRLPAAAARAFTVEGDGARSGLCFAPPATAPRRARAPAGGE